MRVEQWTAAPALAAFGLLFIGYGLWRWHSMRRFDRMAVRTRAIYVRDYHREAGGSSLPSGMPTPGSYIPELSFHTDDGRRIETIVVDAGGDDPHPEQYGRDVAILYDPADPEQSVRFQAHYTGVRLRWPLLNLACGVLLLAGAVLIWSGVLVFGPSYS